MGGELVTVVELGLQGGPEALALGIVPAHPWRVRVKAVPGGLFTALPKCALTRGFPGWCAVCE